MVEHDFTACVETLSLGQKGKGTSLLVPLSRWKYDGALAPEVRFIGLDEFFRICSAVP